MLNANRANLTAFRAPKVIRTFEKHIPGLYFPITHLPNHVRLLVSDFLFPSFPALSLTLGLNGDVTNIIKILVGR